MIPSMFRARILLRVPVYSAVSAAYHGAPGTKISFRGAHCPLWFGSGQNPVKHDTFGLNILYFHRPFSSTDEGSRVQKKSSAHQHTQSSALAEAQLRSQLRRLDEYKKYGMPQWQFAFFLTFGLFSVAFAVTGWLYYCEILPRWSARQYERLTPQVEVRRSKLDHFLGIGTPICRGCGDTVSSDHLFAWGLCWHKNHFVCGVCHKELNLEQSVLKDNHLLCQQHASMFTSSCSLCDSSPSYFRLSFWVNMWGDTVCAKHKAAACKHCGSYFQLPDHRTGKNDSCQKCTYSLIDTDSAAQLLLQEIRTDLRILGIDLKNASIEVELGSDLTLSQSRHSGEVVAVDGLTSTVSYSNGYRQVQRVQIATGLPWAQAGQVMAHELMHCWLFLNRYPKFPPVVEEGLCELVSYLWMCLRRFETDEKDIWRKKSIMYRIKQLELSTTPVYGQGFQLALLSLRHLKLKPLLSFIQRNGTFPPLPVSSMEPQHQVRKPRSKLFGFL